MSKSNEKKSDNEKIQDLLNELGFYEEQRIFSKFATLKEEPSTETSLILEIHIKTLSAHYWTVLAALKNKNFEASEKYYIELKKKFNTITETIDELMIVLSNYEKRKTND